MFGIDLMTIIPMAVALLGGLFGYYQKSQATKAKAATATYKAQAAGEKVRADTNETVAKAIIEDRVKVGEEIENVLKKAKIDRSEFFNSDPD